VIALPLAVLAAAGPVAGVVFADANANGRRDAGEPGLAGVVVSDGRALAASGPDGAYRLAVADGRNVFVVLPGERRAADGWFKARAERVDFALAPSTAPDAWRFAHLSDTHVHPGNVERTRRALALAAGRSVELAVVSGDLIKDALRVDEATARGLFELYAAESAKPAFPVRSAPGNHEVFGIERHLSYVRPDHPAFAKGMYEEVLGPRYSAFNRGRIHFLMLDTVGIDDLWYYGFLDEPQLEWIRQEVALLPPGTSVVTVGHIPLRSGGLSMGGDFAGFFGEILEVKGERGYRHLVRNAAALERALRPARWTLALQGHTHLAERLRAWDGAVTRYHTSTAVDRQPEHDRGPRGFFVYRVDGAEVDDGELVTLDEAPDARD
jgi:3',5'-cyclic AMP phosphodiesterase CpdA